MPGLDGDGIAVAAAARGQRRRGLAAVIASTTGAGLTIGITYPLLTLVLEGWGVAPAVIGLNSAMPALAALGLAPLLPRLMGAIGALRALYLGIGLTVAALLAMGLVHDLAAWFVLRFVGGAGLVVHWAASEAWINAVTDERRRGRVIALYTTLFSAGLAGGPLVLGLVGTDGLAPFLAVAAVIAASALPLPAARGAAPVMPTRPARSVLAALVAAPLVMAAALVSGFADTGVLALLPLHGLRSGLDEAAAVAMLSAFVLGGIALQLPLGWLGDRGDRRRLLLLCAGACALLALLLPLAVGRPGTLWPLLFLWGGSQIGLYTLGLILLGERFGPAELAAANAAFIALYEAGSLVGPAAIGGAMQLLPAWGLPAGVALAAGLFLAMGLARRPPPPASGR